MFIYICKLYSLNLSFKYIDWLIDWFSDDNDDDDDDDDEECFCDMWQDKPVSVL